MNYLVLLLQAHPRDDSASRENRDLISSNFNESQYDPLVILDIRGDVSQIEVTVGAGVVVVARAHAVAAVPEEPTPPAVDFGRRLLARFLLSVSHTVLVLDVLVAPIAVFVLKEDSCLYSFR